MFKFFHHVFKLVLRSNIIMFIKTMQGESDGFFKTISNYRKFLFKWIPRGKFLLVEGFGH